MGNRAYLLTDNGKIVPAGYNVDGLTKNIERFSQKISINDIPESAQNAIRETWDNNHFR